MEFLKTRGGDHHYFLLDGKEKKFATSECEIENSRSGATIVGFCFNHLNNIPTSKINVITVRTEKIVIRSEEVKKFDLSFWLQDNPRKGRGHLRSVELEETLELSIHHQTEDGVLIDTLDKLNIMCHFLVENVSATFNLEFAASKVRQGEKKNPTPPYLNQLMKEERDKMPIGLLHVMQLIPEMSVSAAPTPTPKFVKKKNKWKPLIVEPKLYFNGRPG